MTDEIGAPRGHIKDVGIETGAARLTPEIIRKTALRMLHEEAGARLRTYLDICVRCGLCSNACHYYNSMGGDPTYSPAGKVKETLSVIMAKNGRVDVEFMKKACEIAFTECNLCRRCAMYCPLGIDTATMMLFVRRLCHKLGMVPQYIQDTAHSHSATMNQMWVKEDEWIDSLQWQENEAREEVPDLRIPLEKEGADVFYSVIGPEPKFRAQLIYQAAVIFHKAGVNWTMPATPGWDNSDMCMYTGDMEMMSRLKKLHFETALRLRAKRIVMGECGHAFRSVYDMGNRALGWRYPPVPVIHAIDFFHEILTQGKIKVAQKYEKPVTIHDPCNIVRGRGLHEKLREAVGMLCETVIEMEPNREHNYCCAAGGGVINCGPPFKMKRVLGARVKGDQLMEVHKKGGVTCIAPCHNCHGGLEDILHHYKIPMDLKFLGDIIYQCMEK